MSARIITIKDSQQDITLASAPQPAQVDLFEGAWYFEQETVNMEHLVVTDRTYVCPYKGTCYWIDLNLPNHQGRNVAWTYFDVHSGYNHIHNRIAFHAGRRAHTIEVDD